MNTEQTQNTRAIPPIPGGGSWTFNEERWAWISNDPVPAKSPAEADQVEAATEQASPAADQE